MISRVKNKIEKYLELYVILMIQVVFSLSMAIINEVPIGEGIFYAAFQIGGILFPGMAVLFIARIYTQSRLTFLALSYAIGYCFNIVIYYMTVPFGIKKILPVFFCIYGIVSIVIFYRNREKFQQLESDRKGILVCLGFIIALIILEVFTFSGYNLIPPKVAENEIYNDMMHWIGNTITLTKGYPAVSFREYPKPYTYHFFSSMQLAVISLTIGIRPVILTFSFSFLQPILLMVLGAWLLFRKITGKYIIIIAGIVILLFTCGKSDWTGMAYQQFVLCSMFGFDVGMGLFLYYIYHWYCRVEKGCFEYKTALLNILLFVVVLGVKSPFGVMALLIEGVTCLWWLIKKHYKEAFGFGIPILISFIIMYIFVINLGTSDQNEKSLLDTFFRETPYIYYMSDFLRGYHDIYVKNSLMLLRPILEVPMTIFTLLIGNYCLFGIFFVCIFIKAIKMKKWNIIDTCLLTAVFAGSLLTMLWGNYNGSVIYFFLTAFPIATIFSVKAIQEIIVQRILDRVKIKILGIVLLLLICCSLFDAYFSQTGYEYFVKRGYGNYKNKTYVDANINARDYISLEEYETYEWIWQNTEEDTLITCNKGMQLGENDTSRYSRAVGVFTERYVLCNEITDELFWELNYDVLDEIKQMGIEYILYNKTSTEGLALSTKQGDIVYENNANVIYKLK